MNEVPSPPGLLFDLDGVLYVGKEVIPGAIETVTKLREQFTCRSSPTPARFHWLPCNTRSTPWASISHPRKSSARRKPHCAILNSNATPPAASC